MPAPIIRNVDWLENTDAVRMPVHVLYLAGQCLRAWPDVYFVRFKALFLSLYRIVANGRFTRGEHVIQRVLGWAAGLFI